MSRSAMTNATGASTAAPGMRYGRVVSGTWSRNAARDSGAPAYISTLAPVMRPTSERQLGNGSRKNSPNTNAKSSPTHGAAGGTCKVAPRYLDVVRQLVGLLEAGVREDDAGQRQRRGQALDPAGEEACPSRGEVAGVELEQQHDDGDDRNRDLPPGDDDVDALEQPHGQDVAR